MHPALQHRRALGALAVVLTVVLAAPGCALDNPAYGSEGGSANTPLTSTSTTSGISSASETGGIPGDWWDTQWRSRRRLIVINPTAETLIDAPLALHLLPARFPYADASAEGHDLRLLDASNTLLDLEIEHWAPKGTSTLWTRAPTLAPGKTELWLYWSNSLAPPAPVGGLWAPSYDAVYHLSERLEEGARTVFDATTTHDGSAFQTMGVESSIRGVVGPALNFTGVSEDDPKVGDFIVIDGAPIDTDAWSALTLEAWARHTHFGEHRLLCKSPTTATSDHIFAIGVHDDDPGQDPTTLFLRLAVDDSNGVEFRTASGVIDYGAEASWHHIAMTWDSLELRVYVDGSPEPIKVAGADGVRTESLPFAGSTLRDHPLPVTVANLNDTLAEAGDARFWRGDLDEVRLSRRAHSPAWIRFQVESMLDTVVDYSEDDEVLGD